MALAAAASPGIAPRAPRMLRKAMAASETHDADWQGAAAVNYSNMMLGGTTVLPAVAGSVSMSASSLIKR